MTYAHCVCVCAHFPLKIIPNICFSTRIESISYQMISCYSHFPLPQILLQFLLAQLWFDKSFWNGWKPQILFQHWNKHQEKNSCKQLKAYVDFCSASKWFLHLVRQHFHSEQKFSIYFTFTGFWIQLKLRY